MKYKKICGFKSKISLILFIVFIIYIAICSYKTLIDDGTLKNIQESNDIYQICTDYKNATDDNKNKIKNEFYNEHPILDLDEECNERLSYNTPTTSAYYVFASLIDRTELLFPYFIPILVIIPFAYLLSREFKNNIIKNFCLRDNYKNYIKYIFKTAYKCILSIPMVLLIFFLISCIVTNWNLDPSADIGFNYAVAGFTKFLNNKYFLPIYIVTLLLNIAIYINIGLIFLSKNKNFLIILLESELATFFVWFLVEVIIGKFFEETFNIDLNNFSLLNIYTYGGITNIYTLLLVSMCVFLITLGIALYSYHNKEKLIEMCEK